MAGPLVHEAATREPREAVEEPRQHNLGHRRVFNKNSCSCGRGEEVVMQLAIFDEMCLVSIIIPRSPSNLTVLLRTTSTVLLLPRLFSFDLNCFLSISTFLLQSHLLSFNLN
jgi:hypothetical protein